MSKFIIVFICLFGLVDQINSVVVSKTKPTGILYKEQLKDYDVNKKVIFTPVSQDFRPLSL